MAEGLGAPDPFGRRILIPWLVGIISDLTARDVASVFHNLNLLFTFLAGVILLRKHDISALQMLNAQWFGAFTLHRDKESLMILVMFCACCGFSLLMTWPARTFVMLSPVLAPRLVEIIRNDTANTQIVEEASETHERT